MKLYTVNDKYVEYLQNFSKNVKYNKKQTRPYVGIVLQIDEHTYFAPLSSPKPKHTYMKESLDFLKIEFGQAGVINFNNMIPVPFDELQEINFYDYERKYSFLLKKQARWIQENEEKVTNKAMKLYMLITTKENTRFHLRCSDFKLLEEKSSEWSQKK